MIVDERTATDEINITLKRNRSINLSIFKIEIRKHEKVSVESKRQQVTTQFVLVLGDGVPRNI